jgi:hypothetical protein
LTVKLNLKVILSLTLTVKLNMKVTLSLTLTVYLNLKVTLSLNLLASVVHLFLRVILDVANQLIAFLQTFVNDRAVFCAVRNLHCTHTKIQDTR